MQAPTARETAGQVAAPTIRTEQQAPRAQRTAVRFALLDVERPLYEGLIQEFEEQNPGLRVEIVSMDEVLELGALGNPQVPDDADQRLVSAADVVRIGVTRETVEQGLVR
ncbi:MAG: hypothetical protein JXA74_09765, partial [Anaerolineae bacterium]|nr:hypothetical protein [Anaerolineae bacterium]